jgi:signal transduction histidine kinase
MNSAKNRESKMTKKKYLLELLELEEVLAALRIRLGEAEDTLHAIRNGGVDALVISGENGEQIFTLNGTDYLYRVLIEDMSEGAVIMTKKGIIIYANRCFADFLRVPLEKVIGTVAENWFTADSQQIFESILKDGNEKKTGELRLIASDGTQVPIYFSANCVSNLPDHICLVATNLTKIHAQKQKEAAILTEQLVTAKKFHCELQAAIDKQLETEKYLRDLQENLEETVLKRTADLVQARNAAEAANLAKSTFIASMSHELRTPLHAILGFSELMKHDATATEKQKETLEIIHSSGVHLLSMINDVLDISKIEAGKGLELNIQSFDLVKMLQEISDMIDFQVAAKQLNFILDIAPDIPRFIKTDCGKLRQVLLNLLDNAIKFTKWGEVFLRATSELLPDEKSNLIIEVIDSGVGIPLDKQEALFRPFMQLVEKKCDTIGIGLGLTISKSLIELMSGNLSVTSVPGKGSIFRIELPVTILANENNVVTTKEEHSPTKKPMPLKITPEMLSQLPLTLRQHLREMALELDIEEIDKTITQIDHIAPRVAEGLEELAKTYQFEQIVQLTE